jgi:hypothetical protein
MNSCGKCVVTQHQIVAQFYAGPEGFIKARTVLKTGNSLVGQKLLQTHIGGHYCCHFGGRQTMTYEVAVDPEYQYLLFTEVSDP